MASNNLQFSDSTGRAGLLDRIRAVRDSGRMKPDVADNLIVRLGSVQFSDKGAEKVPAGAMGIGDTISMFERQAAKDFSAGSPHAMIAERIKNMRSAKLIEPGVADTLLGRVGSLQFSDNGKEKAAPGGVTISEILDMHERSGQSIAKYLTGGEQTAGYNVRLSDHGASEAEHPAGDQFVRGNEGLAVVGSSAAKSAAAGFLERTGLKKPSVKGDGRDPATQLSSARETVS